MAPDQRRGIDRRLRPRNLSQTAPIAARIRLGHTADVLDLSAHGASIETTQRLRPGTFVDVQLESASYRAQVRARIVHARVTELTADRVRYRGGIVFQRMLDGLAASLESDSPHEWELLADGVVDVAP